MATKMKESDTKDVRSETISSVAVAGGKEKSVCEPGGSGHYGSFQPGDNNKKSRSHGSLTASQDVPTSPSGRTYIYVYCSHFLSAWGDRMWSFGVGLFLVRIAGDNLQLPATYGLASGLAIFLLGALVGDWVDSTPRLKAAQLSLVLQNLLVVVCAAGVYAYIRFEPDISAVPGGWSVPLCHAAVILLAVLADLTSLARVIAVERDWIVKICGTDTDMLAKMTATLRRIDQTTLIVAPIATGQVMTYAGLEFGALFIGAWNLCSVALEYYLMWKVYTTIPALAEKPSVFGTKDVSHHASLSAFRSSSYKAEGPVDEDSVVIKTTPQRNEFSKSHRSELADSFTADTEILLDDSDDLPEAKVKSSSSLGCCCCGRILYQFITLYRGWRTYMRYSVALAGLALSFLYMTVLGFDNITVAYAVTQGVSESILGILMGVSAVFGMLGTFLYPVLRRRVGLVRTGLLALSSQVACLSLCVVSVWMPGSPFDPNFSTVPASLLVNTTQIPTGQMEFANSTLVGFVPSLTPTMTMARLSDPAISSTQKTPLTTVAPPSSSSPSSFIIQVSISVTNNTYFKFTNSTLHPPFPPNATEGIITVTNTSLRQIANLTSPDNRSLSIPPGSELFTGVLPVTEVFTSMSPDPDDTSESPPEDSTGPKSYVSVILLMAGIVLARFGLWTADLAITQLFLEAVVEKERGVVNGVQSSLNKLMDVLKFGLVVVVPDTQTFGFLIIVSFVFICLGWLLYAIFLRKDRGHFFHCPCCGTGADYERL